MALKHENLTGQIIKAFYNVYNELGYGFLEKVYENALALELESIGLRVGRQRPIKVYYLGRAGRSLPTIRNVIESSPQLRSKDRCESVKSASSVVYLARTVL